MSRRRIPSAGTLLAILGFVFVTAAACADNTAGEVAVTLQRDVSDVDVSVLNDALERIDGVRSVTFISYEADYAEMKGMFQEEPDPRLVRPRFEITVARLADAATRIGATVRSNPHVSEVTPNPDDQPFVFGRYSLTDYLMAPFVLLAYVLLAYMGAVGLAGIALAVVVVTKRVRS